MNPIDKLNAEATLRLAPSPIHGVGVFALRDIPQGQRLYADQLPGLYKIPYSSFGKLFPEVRQEVLERWPQVVNGSKFIYPHTRMQAYMNHSDDPNYDATTDTALRDIRAGEEVTEDYRRIASYQQVYPWLTDDML